MTVEATLIMPLVLSVICILIYGSFCVYNRCIGYQDAYLLCLREAQRKDADHTREAARVESLQERQFGSKYICVSSLTGNAEIDGDTVRYHGIAAVGPGIGIVQLLIPEQAWKMQFCSSSEVRDPACRIRKIRRIAAVTEQVVDLIKLFGS